MLCKRNADCTHNLIEFLSFNRISLIPYSNCHIEQNHYSPSLPSLPFIPMPFVPVTKFTVTIL